VEGPQTLNVDLNALTYGHIDWERAHGSLEWLCKKVKEVCETEGKPGMETYENGRSQFLAKTCVMHVIHTFHACRYDKPHGEPGEVETEAEAAKQNGDMQARVVAEAAVAEASVMEEDGGDAGGDAVPVSTFDTVD